MTKPIQSLCTLHVGEADRRGDASVESEDDTSADEALREILGLESTKKLPVTIDVENGARRSIPDCSSIEPALCEHGVHSTYESDSFCILPQALNVSPSLLHRVTEEIVRRQQARATRTYETNDKGERMLIRVEDFVTDHEVWYRLCHVYLQKCVSELLGEDFVLFKEKLNLKPPGGSGFAPHTDTPSLRVPFGSFGPQTFVTVMVAIDDMDGKNGCLRVCRGSWCEHNAVQVVQPEVGANPDGAGRAGAIPPAVAAKLTFEDVCVKAGSIAIFGGMLPHRSAVNTSIFSRRAVFLTYNPAREGDYHDLYYVKMQQLRNEWSDRRGAANC